MSKGKIKEEIDRLMSVIPHCRTKGDALNIQREIDELEIKLQDLD